MNNLPPRSNRDDTIEDRSPRSGHVRDSRRTYSQSQSNTIITNAPPPYHPPGHHNPPLLHLSHLYQQPNVEIRQNEGMSRSPALFEQENLETRRYTPARPSNRNIPFNTARVSQSQGAEHSGYSVRSGPSGEHFYVQGKVFSVIWSEPLGEGARRSPVESRSSNYSRSSGSSDVNVYTNTAIFIVLKVETKFCVCLRMYTYGFRGLECPKLDERERQAHAVAYSSTLLRDTEDDERTQQPPIAVRPSRPYHTLHKKSRINLAKPYPVERNLKVKDLGEVEDFEQLKEITLPYLSL